MNSYYSQRVLRLISVLLLIMLFEYRNGFAADSAQRPGHPPNDQSGSSAFSIHDLNQDGALSWEEYQQFLGKVEKRRKRDEQTGRRYAPPLRFEEIDTNKDGYLTEDEMINALNQRLQKHKRYRNRNNRW
ncbi:MAG: EF-hand domain-containing protein [Sedimenticola sp.]|uniref:EF-hand domain-containing protein n=1 Tax=Sedimenticola thiotaurini TaxID=1543721 RepID=A0A558D5T2_9GAMM|nr:EF-hand domain-containing protein [Sedimenticola sp.]TVT56371.1 MAG: EF-hand domain-containing protein [Sedimenticola thiotaurini]MCW8921739.1 EF-hand domain-containing protein [Sedimenticola sp.]MCW8947047.1 EF-hand domain-containing protein [Sedimenticola sp.]MCW8949466.1 EF-hand domain-containing protein [Sedimenticola sp.]